MSAADGDEARLSAELGALRGRMFSEAEHIVADLLPTKVLALHRAFLATRAQRLESRCCGEASGASAAQIAAYRSDAALAVPTNGAVLEAIQLLRKEIVAMLHEIAALRVFVRLNQPQIEDGNTFGIEVQNEVLGMLNSLYSSGLGFLNSLSGYFSKRGKLLGDMRKRPHVKEYGAAVFDLDDKQFVNLVQSCCDLRNNYAFLHDKIVKNKEKILHPKGRGSHRELTMY